MGAATVAGLGGGEPLPETEAARAIPAATTKTATAMTAPTSHRSPRWSHHRDPSWLDRRGGSAATRTSTGPNDAFGRSGPGRGGPGSSGGWCSTVVGCSGGSPADSRTRRTTLSIAPKARRPGVPWGGSDAGPSVITSLRTCSRISAHLCARPVRLPDPGPGPAEGRGGDATAADVPEDHGSAPVGLRRRTGGCHAIGPGSRRRPRCPR